MATRQAQPYIFLTFFLSQPNPNGQCAKAMLSNGTTVWLMRDCAETSGKQFVCQKRQNLEDIGEH
jgi:hypothetical protein